VTDASRFASTQEAIMIIDPTEHREAKTSPMQIAHSPLFTAREKLEMLSEIKAEVTGERVNPDNLAYDPDEIDAAIQEIKLEVQDGDGPRFSGIGDADGRDDN
jgi:hypothetical protein